MKKKTKRYILGEGHIFFTGKEYSGCCLLPYDRATKSLQLRHVGEIGAWLKGKLVFEVEK